MEPRGEPAIPITRRRFLVTAVSLAGVFSAAGLLAPIVRYAFPRAKAEVAARVRVGSTSQVKPLAESLDFEYQETPCSLLQLEDGTYVGLSRVCTHLGCIITWESDNTRFFCPCHAGVFSPAGKVLAGPPPSPLPTLKVAVQGDEIWVEGWNPA